METTSDQLDQNTPSTPKGELITRADGSQVIKVKKRKRRSKQAPKKIKEKQNPFVKWAVILLLITLIVIPSAGSLFIIAKYNGKAFKEHTEANIKKITQSNLAEISTLKVTPISAKAKAVKLEWDPQSFFKKASFKKLNAHIHPLSFLTQDWTGEDIVASQGDIYLQTPPNYTLKHNQLATKKAYQFNSIRCQNLQLHFGESKNQPKIKNLSATIRQTSQNTSKIILQHGELQLGKWPALIISSGVIIDNNKQLQVNTLIESKMNNGELTIDGTIKKSTQQTITLDLKTNKFPIQELLQEGLKDIFSGPITSHNGTLTYNLSGATDEEQLRVEIPFESNAMEISNLPMLQFLKDFTNNKQYGTPKANYCTGNLVITRQSISIQNLDFISNRLITIKGNLAVDPSGNIDGDLQVGIPTNAISGSTPPPNLKLNNGFYIIPVNISGNIYNPHDNMREQFKSRSNNRLKTEKALSPEKEFEALTR